MNTLHAFLDPLPHLQKRVLLLGGTGEGFELARRLAERADLHVISSLAGRVSMPRLPAGVVRSGGFGGVAGLTMYLRQEGIDIVVDATHPFASQMSHNAEMACQTLGCPLFVYERPPWTPVRGDRWDEVAHFKDAAELIRLRRGRVFLAIGRQELDAFVSCSNSSFIVRSIDPPAVLPPNAMLILGRGPFALEDELEMLRSHGIEHIVSKNSGGAATYSKIEAARILGLTVIMIQRPRKHTVPTIGNLHDLLDEIDRVLQERIRLPKGC